MKVNKQQLKQQLVQSSGVVLVIGMMILAVMMVSVLALSRVIVGEIKMSRSADNSIIAFYAAESGIEKTLYYLKYAKDNSDLSLFTRFETNENYAAGVIDQERNFLITEATTSVDSVAKYGVAQNSVVNFDLIESDGDIAIIDNMPDYYEITWRINDCFPEHASDRLEVSQTSLTSKFQNVDTIKSMVVCNCSYGVTDCTDYSQVISPNKFYRFSLRPMDDEVSQINFVAKRGGAGGVVYIPSEVSIKAKGYYRQSVYHLSARLPVYNPVSGIFSYVIFSEENLIKGEYVELGNQCETASPFCVDCFPGGTCPDEWSEEPPWPDNWGIDDEYWVAGEVGSYNQNNQAQCNAQCNGWTYCGDGTAQNPNGAGAGGPGDDGIEECDDGLNNSDTEANACRTNCADPWCGDGVDDTLTEECDFQDYEAPTPYYSDEDSQYQCTPGCLDTGGYCGDTITQGAFAEECDDGKHCSDLTSCTEDVDCTDIGDELCRKRSGTGCSSVCLTES